jgi:acetolactate synthase II small subunit
MKQHHISIEAYYRPEILERILRVVRHRGFIVGAINMKTTENNALQNGKVQLDLIVISERPINLLSSQLNKLIDVASVNTYASPISVKSTSQTQPVSA